jgi:uncharacterized membrane protein YfhO
MPGPLILEKISLFLDNDKLKKSLQGKQLVFLNDTLNDLSDSIYITEELPAKVTAEVSLSQPKEIILQQAAFPGWKAFYNGVHIPLIKNDLPFVSVKAPAGNGTLVFKFEKYGVVYSALTLHIIVLLTLCFCLFSRIYVRLSSLS